MAPVIGDETDLKAEPESDGLQLHYKPLNVVQIGRAHV